MRSAVGCHRAPFAQPRSGHRKRLGGRRWPRRAFYESVSDQKSQNRYSIRTQNPHPSFTKRTQLAYGSFGTRQFISATNLRDCRNSSEVRRRSAFLSRVNRPCLSAFLFPSGAPDPGAPPCIRQRRFPLTAGDRQNPPRRFRAPQRGLESIGSVLRL